MDSTAPDPETMTDNELFRSMQGHADSCKCEWCLNFYTRLDGGGLIFDI